MSTVVDSVTRPFKIRTCEPPSKSAAHAKTISRTSTLNLYILNQQRASTSQRLLGLIEKGHSVLFIEHNLDIIKTADHKIDLGPRWAQDRTDPGDRDAGEGGKGEEVTHQDSRTRATPRFCKDTQLRSASLVLD